MRAALLLSLALGGCAAEQPDHALGTVARVLFRDLDADPDALPAHLAALDSLLDGLDLDGPERHRRYDLPELSAEFFADVDVPDGIDTADQMRASLAGRSRHTVDENLRAQAEVNQTCINADSVTCHERVAVEDTDADAFVAGEADVLRTANTIRLQTLPLDFWIQAPVDFRRVTLEDGRAAAVGRTWIERGFANDGGGREWTQRFGLDVFIEDPDDPSTTRRYYATWLGPSIGQVPGWFAEPAIRAGLDDGFTNPDAWLDAPGCEVSLEQCLAESPF